MLIVVVPDGGYGVQGHLPIHAVLLPVPHAVLLPVPLLELGQGQFYPPPHLLPPLDHRLPQHQAKLQEG